MPGNVLTVQNLTVRYGSIEAVRDVSIRLEDGEIVALIGPNGAGKSSCVNAILGLVPHSGAVTLRGVPIDKVGTDRMIGLGLSLVPEGRRIFPDLSVLENLIAGGISSRLTERRRSLESVLELFPALRPHLRQRASTLSGGEQQMLAIGRALMGNPSVLLLDEPSLGLAPQIVDEIFQLILGLRDRGVSILLVEQNAERAIAMADRTMIMVSGRIRRRAAAGELAQLNLADIVQMGAAE